MSAHPRRSLRPQKRKAGLQGPFKVTGDDTKPNAQMGKATHPNERTAKATDPPRKKVKATKGPRRVTCAVCEVSYLNPATWTHLQFVQVCEGQPSRAGADAGATCTEAAVTTMLTACKCGTRLAVCAPCLAAYMREATTTTSLCMECDHVLPLLAVRAVFAAANDPLATTPGSLSARDEATVALIGRRAEQREASTRATCPCHGYPMKRTGRYFVLDGEVGAQQGKAQQGKAQQGKAQQGKAQQHAMLCASCLQPIAPGDRCTCAHVTSRQNPFYREPDMLGLRRNNEITPSMATEFLRRLGEMPPGPVECPCGTLLGRTVDCHQVTCLCGFAVCVACGYAAYKVGSSNPLDHHSTARGIDGSEPCDVFPVDYRVHYGGVRVDLKYPCHTADGDYVFSSGHKPCHGYHADCSDPAHQPWLRLYDANRRATQAQKFVAYLAGTPAYAAAAHALALSPETAQYGKTAAV